MPDKDLVDLCPHIEPYQVTKSPVPDYLRKIQINVILHPIIKNLIHNFQENNLESKLIDCLKTLKNEPSGQIGGIAGNIINLLNILKNGYLIGYDFSHIPIRQVDFSNIRLNQVDFSYSQFFDCIFPQTCGSILSISCSQFNRSFPREDLLATGDSHGMIYLWKVKQDGKLELSKSFPAHGSWVWSVALNSEGQLLASGGQDGIVKIWSITTDLSINCHSLPHPSQKHYAPIRAVTFSADSKFLATGSEDKTIKIWSVETGECLHTLEGHQERVGGVTFSPNGQLLASGSADKTIKIWSVETGECLHTLTGHQDWVWQVAFSSDGQLLASGSGDKTIKIWSLIEGEYQNIDTLKGHESWIWSIAFSPDGQYIASGSEDFTLRLWSVKTRECLQCFRGYGNRLSSITFSPDSQYILSGSIDRSIRLWSIKNHKCLQQINGHTDWICSVAFSPDGKTLISGSGDQTIRLWSGESGKVIKILQEKDYWVLLHQVAVSPNGQLIASTSHDNTIKLWDIRTDEKYTFAPEHQKRVWSIAFSPNSQITNLKLTLRNLDPAANSHTEEIKGKEVNYVKSSYPRSMNQNSLRCADRNGYVASITQIVKDRLDTRTPTATRDEISISNKILTCMFTEVNKRGLSCIEYLVNIASTLGLEFYRGTPPQILMEIVTLFPQTVIHPVLDSNMITLQEDPRTIVYCTVNAEYSRN